MSEFDAYDRTAAAGNGKPSAADLRRPRRVAALRVDRTKPPHEMQPFTDPVQSYKAMTPRNQPPTSLSADYEVAPHYAQKAERQ
jgi:hypothetical protein